MHLRHISMGFVLVAAATGDVLAQRYLVPHNSPSGLIALVDARAGLLIDSAWIDVEATAVPSPGANALRDAERVGDEVWVAAGTWVHRYDAFTRTYLGGFNTGSVVRSIEEQGTRVLVALVDRILVYGPDGVTLGEFGIAGVGDTLDLGDGTMLVALRDSSRIDRYTRDGTWLSVFAGPTIPTPLGVLSRPQQLARRWSSRGTNGGEATLLVAGDVRVYEFDLAGNLLDEVDVGPFEGGVADTTNGRTFISLGTGLALYDAETQVPHLIGGAFFGTGRKIGAYDRGAPNEILPGDAGAAPICDGVANSTGRAAWLNVFGTSRADERFLLLTVDRLPPRVLVGMLLARGTRRQVPSVPGLLCLDPASTSIFGQVQQATPDGRAEFTLLRGLQQNVNVLAGVTLYAQALYRDSGRTLLSSAVSVTLE